MINKLRIRNFKSIKDLTLDCSRVNILIGEPNTGKSNILESIGIMSFPYANKLSDIIRFEKAANLFFKGSIKEDIYVRTEDYIFRMHFENNQFIGEYGEILDTDSQEKTFPRKALLTQGLNKENSSISRTNISDIFPIKFYNFKSDYKFNRPELDFILPPFGENLFSILYSNTNVHDFASNLFSKYGYKILLRTEVNEIEILIEDPKLIAFPYTLTSDTLQRIIFYYAILETNKDSIIVLEEPESHIFPFYNEQLALLIANNSNQFFIATHNPYFMNMLINKTPSEDLRVFKVTYENYETKAKPIDKTILQNFIINDNDILLNIDRLD